MVTEYVVDAPCPSPIQTQLELGTRDLQGLYTLVWGVLLPSTLIATARMVYQAAAVRSHVLHAETA